MGGGIWVFVELPQEYWIRVAKLDFTEAVADHRWFGALCLLGLGALAWAVCGNLSVATGLFFAYVTTLIVVLYDTYRPLRAARDARGQPFSRGRGSSAPARA